MSHWVFTPVKKLNHSSFSFSLKRVGNVQLKVCGNCFTIVDFPHSLVACIESKATALNRQALYDWNAQPKMVNVLFFFNVLFAPSSLIWVVLWRSLINRFINKLETCCRRRRTSLFCEVNFIWSRSDCFISKHSDVVWKVPNLEKRTWVGKA